MNNPEIDNFLDSVKQIDVCSRLFKNGDFDFIVKGVGRSGKVEYHEKQREALQILTMNRYKRFVYGGAAGGGKAQPMYSKIYTPFGYKLMKDIKIGDVVKHPNGSNSNVIAIHPQGEKEIYEITFSDGSKTRCCADHLWQVWYARLKSKQEEKNGLGRVRTTKMLIDELARGKRPIIPLTEPVDFNLPKGRGKKVWDKLHPYILGFLIGDGSLTKSLEFSSGDKQVVDRISELLPDGYSVNFKGNYGYSITQHKRSSKGHSVNEIYDLIRNIGLNCKSEKKFIPKDIFHAPLWVRWEFAKGLMDSDGTVDKSHCSYASSSEMLANQFREVLFSLGFRVSIRKKKTKRLDSFVLNIQGRNKNQLFYLDRKKSLVKEFNGNNVVGRRIDKIELVGKELAQCITVSAIDGLYLTDDYVVTHNSWIGCSWLLFMCANYPGTRWFVARNELKDIVDSVYVTFVKVCKEYGFADYKFNSVKNFIEFGNGSFINFIEIKYKPADPEFTDLGSTEYTGGWIEEGGEINEMGATIVGTRVGRHMNLEYGLEPMVFITCNPAQNWIKIDYYDKWEKDELEDDCYYLGALATDNPFLPQAYIDSLMKLAKKSISAHERLFRGNWNYVDSPNALCDRDALDGIFDNDHVPEGTMYLTADVARYGSDKAVIGVWSGWILVEAKVFDLSKTTDIEHAIRVFRLKYRIPKTRCIADADGVGSGVVDGAGIKGFVNGARPIKERTPKGLEMPEYRNLQVQCLYKLAETVNESNIWIRAELSNEQKQHIVQELYQIQSKNTSNRKLDCKSKADIKADIGRSPDWRDMIMMRKYFDLKPARRNFMGSRPRETV